MVYVPYGKSGGAKADKDLTEAIIEAIKVEIDNEYHKPTLIMGDFNSEPGNLRAIKALLDSQQWLDVGANASWWGGEDGTPTCQTRPQAKPTRIDGIIANRMAIPWISGFAIEKDEMIPTHSVLQIVLDSKAPQEERVYAKNCLH